MLQRYKIFLNGCNITTFFNTIHSFFCWKITKNTLKTTFYLNVTKTKKVDFAWASNEKAADSHDGLSAADAKEEQLPGCVEHNTQASEMIEKCHFVILSFVIYTFMVVKLLTII